jgi:hypothetical protein
VGRRENTQKAQARSRQMRPLTRLTLLGMAVNGVGRVVRAVFPVLPLEPRRLWRQASSPYPSVLRSVRWCQPLLSYPPEIPALATPP